MSTWPWLFAQQAEPLIQRLDPPTRAKVLLALGAVIVLGIAMVVVIWLAGRATRRYMSSGNSLPAAKPGVQQDDWARKPLVPPLDDSSVSDGT